MAASFDIRQSKTVIRSPTTGSQGGEDRSIFMRVKLLENVAMLWA
jgi:hypothetical protein